MKYIVTIVFVLLFCASCSEKNQDKSQFPSEIIHSQSYKRVESHSVIINNKNSVVIPYAKIEESIKDVKYIPLISKEPIGMIANVMVHDERIYVLDAYRSECIYIFDFSGGLVKVINNKGEGPQEYIALADMCISKANNELVVSDRLSLNILYYTLDGEFLRKTKATPNGYIEMMGDSRVNVLTYRQSFSKDVNYHIITSLGDSIIRKGFPCAPIQKQAVNSRPLSFNYKNELLFNPVLSDTIYQIINDSLFAVKYVVDHKKSIWLKKEESLGTEEYRNLIKEFGYTMLGNPILENQNYLAYRIGEGKDKRIIQKVYWYDKRKGISFALGDRKNQHSPILSWIPQPTACWNNYFIGVFDAVQINELKQYLTYNDNLKLLQNEMLKSILYTETKDLEAILVLYEFH